MLARSKRLLQKALFPQAEYMRVGAPHKGVPSRMYWKLPEA